MPANETPPAAFSQNPRRRYRLGPHLAERAGKLRRATHE
jgi:hypothetical protein